MATLARMGNRWGLSGRDDELNTLINGLRSHGSGILVTGDAGVGKSRLLDEFAAAESSRRVVRITGFSALSEIPFGATSAWVGAAPAEPAALIEAVLDAIVGDQAPGTAVPIVIVDDAQWLDDASATVVNRLASRRSAFVVVAIRTLENAPDPIVGLWRDETLGHLALQPLTFTATQNLLEQVLGGRLHRQTAEDLWKLTAGNLLYIREIVNADLASGRLAADDGGEWLWQDGPSVTETLTELIDKQLGDLADPMAELVDVLAIAGALDIDTLTAVGGIDPQLIDKAEKAGLLVVDGEPSIARLVHPLYAEVRMQRMGRLRRARLQGAVADAMGAHPTGNPRDTILRAVTAAESGQKDPGLFLAGAAAATAWCDIALTLSLSKAAIEAGGGLPAEMLYAYTLTNGNQGPEADEALAALLAKPDLADDQHALLTFMYAGNRHWVLQRPQEAEVILEDAVAGIAPGQEPTILTALRGALAAYRARPDDALRFTATALADPTLIGVPHIFAAMGRTISLGATGRYTEIDEYRERAHTDAAVSAPGATRYSLLTLELQAAAIAGDLAVADEIAATYSTEASDLPGFARTLTTYMRGYAAYFHGNTIEAADCIRGVVTRLAEDPRATSGWEYACRNRLGTLYALAGDPDKAAGQHTWIEEHPHPSMSYVDTEILLSRGWVSTARGQLTRALEYAAEAIALARERGEAGNEVVALQVATQWGDDSTHSRLAELAETVEGPRVTHAARHAKALAERDADALWESSQEWVALGDQIAAADAAAQAAVVYAGAGKRTRAQQAGDAARSIAVAHGFTTPALRALTAPADLTRREWEIVGLIGRGLTSRQIADDLGLSTRTVEGHIYRAMQKTDCADRTELKRYARDA